MYIGDANLFSVQRRIDTLYILFSLKLTFSPPGNGWLEDDRFLLGFGLFSGAKMLVPGRVNSWKKNTTGLWYLGIPLNFFAFFACLRLGSIYTPVI